MPLYVYQCHDCKADFEKLVAQKQANGEVECPACGSHKTTRGLSAPAKSMQNSNLAQPMSGCGVGPPCGAQGCRRISPS
jgi:putative FmdB family regulatory protein